MKPARAVPLTNGGQAIVDASLFEKLSKHPWYRHPKGHAQRSVNCGNKRVKTLYMHRVILGVTDPKVQVDHKDRDKLNNRRENLRRATNGQNQRNRAKIKRGSSKFKGVHLLKKPNLARPWAARISVDGRRIELGKFASEVEAAEAYNKAAKRLFGRFARPNEIV